MAQLIYKNWRERKQAIDFLGISSADTKFNKGFPVSAYKARHR